jgi:tRNA threonylcarbamoyladenosine biosynthesis protein TsaE
MGSYFVYDLKDLDSAAARVAADLHRRIVLFRGEMGAGKTTFIKALCRQLGAKDDMSSPTYSLANEYHIKGGKIYHLDLYRLRSVEEALDMGIEDYLFDSSYCFVEWPDLIKPLLRAGEFIEIEISSVSENCRKVSIFNQL